MKWDRMAETDTERAVPDSRASSPVRRYLTIGIVIAAMAVLALGFGATARFSPPEVTPSDPPPVLSAPGTASFVPTPQQLLNLAIKPVESRTFRAETATDGTIALDDDLTTAVFSPFSGRVTRIFAKLGDRVERGAPLMMVEASEFVQAQSDLITAKAQFNLAETNEKRQHELYEAEGAALRDWERSQVDLAAAEATLAAVRNRLRIFGKTDREIAELEGTPKVPAMNPESIVAAPISGTVVQRQVGVGQYIQSGSSNSVFSIGDLSKVWMIANVREVDGSLVHVGDAVEVHVLAFPDRVFKAKLSYVAPSMDPNTHRLAVRADVDNRDGLLKPQMFANFTILTGSDIAAPAVPKSAIVYEGETARVWILAPNGALTPRQIQIGRTDGELVEVINGLTPGEKVVVSGGLFIDRAAAGQ
jgi:cobalt-zinc-cadmium efflux system membrane fusion protein